MFEKFKHMKKTAGSVEIAKLLDEAETTKVAAKAEEQIRPNTALTRWPR